MNWGFVESFATEIDLRHEDEYFFVVMSHGRNCYYLDLICMFVSTYFNSLAE
jgi:hypothetical protein